MKKLRNKPACVENSEAPDSISGEKTQVDTQRIRINEFLHENVLIKEKKEYHSDKTRHDLAKILVIALVLAIFVFGILHALVEKAVIERLGNYSSYSIAILGSLTGAACGYFFGRDKP